MEKVFISYVFSFSEHHTSLHIHFLQLVDMMVYDHLVLVDLLTSPETKFREYLVKYLKLLVNTWTEFMESLTVFAKIKYTEGSVVENESYETMLLINKIESEMGVDTDIVEKISEKEMDTVGINISEGMDTGQIDVLDDTDTTVNKMEVEADVEEIEQNAKSKVEAKCNDKQCLEFSNEKIEMIIEENEGSDNAKDIIEKESETCVGLKNNVILKPEGQITTGLSLLSTYDSSDSDVDDEDEMGVKLNIEHVKVLNDQIKDVSKCTENHVNIFNKKTETNNCEKSEISITFGSGECFRKDNENIDGIVNDDADNSNDIEHTRVDNISDSGDNKNMDAVESDYDSNESTDDEVSNAASDDSIESTGDGKILNAASDGSIESTGDDEVLNAASDDSIESTGDDEVSNAASDDSIESTGDDKILNAASGGSIDEVNDMCESDSDEVLDLVMGMLIRVRLKLERLYIADLLPYKPDVIVTLLEMVESKYEDQ